MPRSQRGRTRRGSASREDSEERVRSKIGDILGHADAVQESPSDVLIADKLATGVERTRREIDSLCP